MRKNQYLYLGDKTGGKMYYNINDEKFYRTEGANSGLQTSVIAFAGIVFSVMVKDLNAAQLHYNETAYVICSAVVGLLLSFAFQQYGIKANEKYFLCGSKEFERC